MVEPLPVEVRPEADVVLVLYPVEVRDVLGLRILPIVGHEVVVNAHGGEAFDVKLWPATLEGPSPIGSRDAEHVGAYVLSQPRLLRGGALTCPAEVSVHDEGGSEGVGAHDGKPVGIPVTLTGVAAPAYGAAHEAVAKDCRRHVSVMQHTERPD